MTRQTKFCLYIVVLVIFWTRLQDMYITMLYMILEYFCNDSICDGVSKWINYYMNVILVDR